MNDMDTDNDPFPDTLEGFGYEFNDKGQLRKIGTGAGHTVGVADKQWRVTSAFR